MFPLERNVRTACVPFKVHLAISFLKQSKKSIVFSYTLMFHEEQQCTIYLKEV